MSTAGAVVLGIIIVAACVACFLLLVFAAIVIGYYEVSDQETIALDDELRKAGM